MQETRTFVRLCNLLDITYENETEAQAASWRANVLNSVGENAYGLYTDEEGCEETAEFTCDEMEFASVDVYDFMGSEYEAERFYAKDIVVFMNKANKNYYVLNAENLWEF
jgi:hypothetical protein